MIALAIIPGLAGAQTERPKRRDSYVEVVFSVLIHSASCCLQSVLLLRGGESNRGQHSQANPGKKRRWRTVHSVMSVSEGCGVFSVFTDGQQNGENLVGLQKSP